MYVYYSVMVFDFRLTEWTYDYFDVESYQNSTMFVALNISILFPSIIFFYGPPYQKRLHTNR